jgi:hypothetical protein
MPVSVADLTRMQQERQRAQAYADACDAAVLKDRLQLAKDLEEQVQASAALDSLVEMVRKGVAGL